MGIYTIHLKPGAAAELAASPASVSDAALRGVKIIREGFSWPAFILGPLWLLWHRLWLALALYALFFALVWGLPGLDDIIGSNPFAVILAHIFLGLEAHSLRAWKLSRSGFRLTDIIVARGLEEAARRFFKRMINEDRRRGQKVRLLPLTAFNGARRAGTRPAEHDVLGLFSRPEHLM
jgi:hypothetical protein